MNIKELQKRTTEVVKNFPRKQWKAEVRMLDLVEEVGELCNAILIKEGHKGQKRAKSDLKDSLVDILFDIILLADIYKVNLDEEYVKMLEDIIKRQKEKQFD